jgi:hypothetical protein
MNILTTCIKSKSDIRNSEILYSLKKNNENPKVQSITLISEDECSHEFTKGLEKCNFILINSRVKFSHMVSYANDNFENKLVGITNADICFDDSLPTSIPSGYAFCLTRWRPDLDFNNPNSASFCSFRFLWLHKTYKKAYEEIKKFLKQQNHLQFFFEIYKNFIKMIFY